MLRWPGLVLFSALLLCSRAGAATLVIDAADFASGTDLDAILPGVLLEHEANGGLLTGQPIAVTDDVGGPAIGRRDLPGSSILRFGTLFIFNNEFASTLRISVTDPVASIRLRTRATGIGRGDHILAAFDAAGDELARHAVGVGASSETVMLELLAIPETTAYFRFTPQRSQVELLAWVERIEITTVPEPGAGILLLALAAAAGRRPSS